MLPVIEQAFEIIQGSPGIGSGALAKKLGIPPCNARRAAKALVVEGRVTITGDQLSGYRYWTGSGACATSQIPARQQVIDATFREIPATSSTSKALVPIGQPYDSRIAETLARNAAARRAQGGFKLDHRIAAALNNSFVADPEGDETLSALAVAINRNTNAVQAVERQRREEAARAVAERPSEPPPPSWTDLLLAACAVGAGALNMNTHQSLARQKAESRAREKPNNPLTTPPAPMDFDTRRQFEEPDEEEFEE